MSRLKLLITGMKKYFSCPDNKVFFQLRENNQTTWMTREAYTEKRLRKAKDHPFTKFI